MSMVASGTASALTPILPVYEQCVQVQEVKTGNYKNGQCSEFDNTRTSEWTYTYVGGRLIEPTNNVWCQAWQEIPREGNYKNSNCTEREEKKGQYHKVKHRPRIRIISLAGKLRSANGIVIKCSSDEAIAEFISLSETATETEWENAAQATVIKKISFKGCKAAEKECKSPGAAAEEITTRELKGTLGYIKKATEVGEALEPKSGTEFSEFECTILGVKAKAKVTGCIIGKFESLNTTGTTDKLNFKEKTGEKSEQEPNKLEGGSTCELTEEDNVVKKPEKSAITQESTVETEDAVRIVA